MLDGTLYPFAAPIGRNTWQAPCSGVAATRAGPAEGLHPAPACRHSHRRPGRRGRRPQPGGGAPQRAGALPAVRAQRPEHRRCRQAEVGGRLPLPARLPGVGVVSCVAHTTGVPECLRWARALCALLLRREQFPSYWVPFFELPQWAALLHSRLTGLYSPDWIKATWKNVSRRLAEQPPGARRPPCPPGTTPLCRPLCLTARRSAASWGWTTSCHLSWCGSATAVEGDSLAGAAVYVLRAHAHTRPARPPLVVAAGHGGKDAGARPGAPHTRPALHPPQQRARARGQARCSGMEGGVRRMPAGASWRTVACGCLVASAAFLVVRALWSPERPRLVVVRAGAPALARMDRMCCPVFAVHAEGT